MTLIDARPAISLKSQHSPLQVNGHGRIAFKHDAERGTVIKTIGHSDPMRVIVPKVPRTELPLGVFVTTSGGLVSGDRLSLEAAWGSSTAAQVMPQAAEKIYRSEGPITHVEMSLSADENAWMEYLPQETILFDRSRLSRRLRVQLHPTTTFLIGDLVVLGRHAMGETYQSGAFTDDWEVHIGKKLAWADRLNWDGHVTALRAHAAGLATAQGFGTILYRGSGSLDDIRAITEDVSGTVQIGVTSFKELTLIRLLAADAFELRWGFGEVWRRLRSELQGLSPILPRLWHI